MKRTVNIHLTYLFFILFFGGIKIFVWAFFLTNKSSFLMNLGYIFFIVLFFLTFFDALLIHLYREPLALRRVFQKRANLGDKHLVELQVLNKTNAPLNIRVQESFPIELQRRNEAWPLLLAGKKRDAFHYTFTPNTRGRWKFGNPWVFLRSPLFLCSRRIVFELEDHLDVYPSVLQMKQYELKVFNRQSMAQGIKKVRRIGNTTEFEQIRNYIQGDDLRTINWKATSRKNELMVNQFQEERSQNVYCIIDKSRPMQSEFEQMTMMDYAINSTLVMSNICLRKGDKSGVITFSNKIGATVPAERNSGQLKRILEALFNQKTLFKEANFELLFQHVKKTVKTRSLLMLFTNFESESSMKRFLPVLQKLNKQHVLVVVFFENNELIELSQQQIITTKDVVQIAVAERMINTKHSIARELRQYGIQTILTTPQDLSIAAINKYLEIKAKGSI